jgi:hypothetical protein
LDKRMIYVPGRTWQADARFYHAKCNLIMYDLLISGIFPLIVLNHS